MAKAYHNLDGWMRDVRNALRDGDTRSYELAELLLELDDLIVAPDDDAGVEDAEDSTGGQRDLPVGVPHGTDSRPMGGLSSGHAPSGQQPLGGPSGMGDPLVGHDRASELARAAIGNARPLGPTGNLRRVGA